MSHYEERLEADLVAIRRRIATVGERVVEAVRTAVSA